MELTEPRQNPYVLTAREAAKRGELESAEKRYRQALRFSEQLNGKDSPAYGLVLLELCDFYEKQGRQVEADECWKGICGIVTAHV